jgi:hypothetical protein
MASERVRIATLVQGEPQFYVRESEVNRAGKWIALPNFDPDPRRALIMKESIARILEQRLLGLRLSVWLEDLNWNARRLDPPQINTSPSSEFPRESSCRVCLDDPVTPQSKWYAVYPANTPNGPKWFIRANPPGLNPYTIYDDTPVLVVERAAAMRMLEWAERAPSPEETKPQAPKSTPSPRVRPGDR